MNNARSAAEQIGELLWWIDENVVRPLDALLTDIVRNEQYWWVGLLFLLAVLACLAWQWISLWRSCQTPQQRRKAAIYILLIVVLPVMIGALWR